MNDLIGLVNRGLLETGGVLSAMSNADLSLRVEGRYEGSFLKLKDDTNSVVEKLSEIIDQLRETSGSLKLASEVILEGVNDLSMRTQKQSATIEETSEIMERLSDIVVKNASQADEANKKSLELLSVAEKSGKVVKKTTDAMERISNSSAKISNVIGMIDDIAFQTNLLALNASVEAARAGEAGKGFAVVAVEVRRLAQSAAEASAEVKQLIEQSAFEVEQGASYVNQVSKSLLDMIPSIEMNSQSMQEIAASSREQASSIEEMGSAVKQLDEMTHHNAALVKETNISIEQTNAQVNELDAIIEIFKLEPSPQDIAKREEIKAQKANQPYNRRASDKKTQASSLTQQVVAA